MSKGIFKFRIHTGQYDSDGEICLFWIGSGLVPDGPDHVWMTTPAGENVLRVEKSKVEPVDDKEIAENLMHEAKLIRKRTNSPLN